MKLETTYDVELKKQWAKESAPKEQIASHSASVMSAEKRTNYNMDDPMERIAKKVNDLLYMLENRDQIIAAKSASLSQEATMNRINVRRTLELNRKLINSLK